MPTKSAYRSFLLCPVLGLGAVCNVSVVLQVPSLPVLSSPVVSVPGLVCFWSSSTWFSSDRLALVG